jgi:transcriptional regulator with XRE-family HTH domain
MKTISQINIGSRIVLLRKNKGYSQEDLAKLLDIPRTSLTQIELGNRNISIIELQKISEIFTISIDSLLIQNFDLNMIFIKDSKPEKLNKIRISVPKLKLDKFKNILLYILEKCAGKPNVGETLLYKLLYFADFNYFEIYEEHLSGAEYRKLPYGPVPKHIDSVINKMITSNQIMRVKTEYHGYPQSRYLPLVKPNLEHLKASEKEVIDKVIDQFSDWSASKISEYSHKDMPWLASKDGEIIDYELAFYREFPYSSRNYTEDSL